VIEDRTRALKPPPVVKTKPSRPNRHCVPYIKFNLVSIAPPSLTAFPLPVNHHHSPLFPFHNAPVTAQPDAISSSRAGPRAPSELDATHRAAGATPHRPEHHRAIAAPLPGPPFSELPRQCLPILRSVCTTASNLTLVLRNPTRAFPDLHASRRRRETPNRR
jgi:hypothetical protein